VLDYGLSDATFGHITIFSKFNPNLKSKNLFLTPKIKILIQTLISNLKIKSLILTGKIKTLNLNP
jgi:hypothetical protein